MRFSHGPACRRQRIRVARRDSIRAQAPQTPAALTRTQSQDPCSMEATTIVTLGDWHVAVGLNDDHADVQPVTGLACSDRRMVFNGLHA